MKILKIALPASIILLVLIVLLAPIGPLPGFFIGGEEAAVPDKWFDTSEIHEIKLEVSGDIPRVVIIWVVQVDGALHVVGSKDSGWVSKLINGGDVKVRIEDKTYPMQANLLSQNFEAVLLAYQDKYRADYPDIINDFPGIEEAKNTAAVFRLTVR